MTRLTLSDEEFDELRTLLARAAGLVFDDARRDSMAFSVAERLRETGATSVRSYLALLQGSSERQRLLDEVTIQETHFFRNPPQVRALRQTVLPELLHAAAATGRRRLRVWSAGCSTGEEPYSVAMLLHELLPPDDGWDVRILATDVSQRALDAAARGTYGPRAVQMAEPDDLRRFFTVGPDGTHAVRPEIRRMVEFRHHNLVTDATPFAAGDVDLVLCRNVTIYFGRETTRQLIDGFHTTLRDGGYLFLGHSETLWQVSDEFRLVALGHGDSAAFVYRRQPPAGPAADRRLVLPDRRTGDDGPPFAGPERRRAPRRSPGSAPAPALHRELASGHSNALTGEAPPELAVPAADALTGSRRALQSGDYPRALELAAQALEADPLNAAAHYLSGVALAHLGRDPEAAISLRKAVYLSPQDGFAHFWLAGTLSRLGDLAAARREYAAAAVTLGCRPQDAAAPELGGRSVRELAALCHQLSQQEAT